MSLQTELNALFADMSKQSASNPDNGIVGLPTQAIQPTQVTPEPVTQAAPTVDPNVDQNQVEPAPVIAPVVTPPVSVKAQLDEPADGWDVEDSVTVPTQVQPDPVNQPQFDFSDIAKVLGEEKIQSKDDLVKAVSTVKGKVELLNNIPETLAKAVEIANLNGNYLEYLGVSQIDWSKEDPIQLYENYVINQFTDQNGAVDFERVDKLLDKIDDDEKELKGRELQKTYIAQQAFQRNQIEQEARQKKANFENELKRSIDAINDIAGYKLTPAHKADLFSYISSGQDLKESNISQRVQNAFIKKNFSKIDNFRKQQIRNSVKKEVLDEAVLPQITPVTASPDAAPQTGYTMDSFLKELESKQKKRF